MEVGNILLITLLGLGINPLGPSIFPYFPTKNHISWEAHLFGAINGIVWAFYYKKKGPQRKKYSWEIEEEILKSLDGIEIEYETVNTEEKNKPITEIIYEYKRKAPS